jgi:hypothetical protein
MTHQPNNVSAAGVLTDEQIKTALTKEGIGFYAHGGILGNAENLIAAIRRLLAAASAQATAPVGWFVQRSSFGPWIEVERYEDGAVRLHRMDGDQATGPAVQFTPSQLATLYMALGHFKSSGSVKCADSIMSIIKMDRG